MALEVTIADAIKQLRAQLEEARYVGEGKGLQFNTKSIEVELTIVLKAEVEGSVGGKTWFVDLSGKAKSAREGTHKVKLVLEPREQLVMDRPIER